MSDSEVDYLQPDFDPASVTIPRLRSILVSHNIQYPATAKKAQLIEIFNENVVPQAKRILDRRAKAKRSSMGITNIDNSVGYTVVGTEDMRPPPSASRSRGRPKKNLGSAASSFTAPSEEPEPEQTPRARNTSPRKRQARSTSRQLGYSDTDTDSQYEARRSVRKSSRRIDLTPQPEVKIEDESENGVYFSRQSAGPDTNFSTDNPFQSGSSPLASETPTQRRKTAHLESPVKKPTTASTRRRTEVPDETAYQGYSKSIEVPVNRFTRQKTPRTPEPELEPEPEPVFEDQMVEDQTVEASEEFTPEEQLALAQEDAARAQTAVVPHRPKRSSGVTTPFWLLFITVLGAYGAWFRQEKVAVGYCGVGKPTQEIVPRHINYQNYDFDVPEWAIQLAEPQCEPCPPHAYCYADNSVRCEEDFILKPHPLSAGGLIPLPPTCEPDGEKVRRVKAVADKAVEELRERRAKFECGELVDEHGKQPETPAIAVEELKEVVSEQRSKKLSKKEFDDLWASALGEIETRDEIEVASNEVVEEIKPNDAHSGAVSNTFISSTSLARLPLTCAARRSVRLGLERHRFGIVSVIFSLLSALYARGRYRRHRAIAAQIPALVDLVLSRLATQKELAYEEGGEDDPFLFLPHLRDDVLRSVHSVSERERIWQRARAVVEQNTNVRTGQREGKNGEVGRAWEWIGPSGIGEGSARRRARLSYVADAKVDGVEDRSGLHKQWEEPGSRPVY